MKTKMILLVALFCGLQVSAADKSSETYLRWIYWGSTQDSKHNATTDEIADIYAAISRGEVDSTKTYKGRKSTGIVHATELVPTDKWNSYILKHPKKDDLADCFLQGLWVMEH
jgi:hypothetical protein